MPNNRQVYASIPVSAYQPEYSNKRSDQKPVQEKHLAAKKILWVELSEYRSLSRLSSASDFARYPDHLTTKFS